MLLQWKIHHRTQASIYRLLSQHDWTLNIQSHPYRVMLQRKSCVQRLQTRNSCSSSASFNWRALTGSACLPDGISSGIPKSRCSWFRFHRLGQAAVSDLQSQAMQALSTVPCSMSHADMAVSQVNEFYLTYIMQARHPPKWDQLCLKFFEVNKFFLF